MQTRWIPVAAGTFALIAAALLSSCTLSSYRSAGVKLSFSSTRTFPTGANCLAINVVSPGLGQEATPRSDSLEDFMGEEGYCSIIGPTWKVVPGPISGEDVSVNLNLPSGRPLLIQVLALKTTSGNCAIDLPTHLRKRAGSKDPEVPFIYEVGRLKTQVSGGERLSITNAHLAANPKEVRCNCSRAERAITTGFVGGNGSEASPYGICTIEQWGNFTASSSLLSSSFVLKDDIDFYAKTFTKCAGTYAGVFNGDGFAMKNVVYASTDFPAGIFQESNGTIKNLNVEDATFTLTSGINSAGILLGTNKSAAIVENCRVQGYLTGQGATLSSGGLVGDNSGRISDSHADVMITASGGAAVGGLVGSALQGVIERCSAKGIVTGSGTETTGGLIGAVIVTQDDVVVESFSTATVSGGDLVGGFVGVVSGVGNHTGIRDSYETGNVSGTSRVGGFVGKAWTLVKIARSYAAFTNLSSNTSSYGGFAGELDPQATIQGCFSGTTGPSGTGVNGLGLAPTQAGYLAEDWSFPPWVMRGSTPDRPILTWQIN